MNEIERVEGVRTWVVVAVMVGGLMVGGCTSTDTRDTPRAAAFEPAAPTEAQAKLPPLKLKQRQTIEGRELAVYATKPPPILPGGVYVHSEQQQIWTLHGHEVQELRDAVTNKVLLPLQNQQIMLVPGRGVFVRVVNDGQATTPWQDWKERAGYYNQLIAWRTAGGGQVARWSRFDLETGLLEATEIVTVEAYAGDRAGDATLPAELRGPSYLFVHAMPTERAGDLHVGRLDAEVISPDGQRLGYFPHFATASVPQERKANKPLSGHDLLRGRRRFSVIETYRADGTRQQHLLGRLLEPLATPPETIAEFVWDYDSFKGTYGGSVIGKRVAGEEKAWTILQSNGVFGTPPGVRFFRPLYDTAGSAQVNGWLVRYALPGEPGHDPAVNPLESARAWGMADHRFAPRNGPVWDEVQRVRDVAAPNPQDVFAVESRYQKSFVARAGDEWVGIELEWRGPTGQTYLDPVRRASGHADMRASLQALRRAIGDDFQDRMQRLAENQQQITQNLFVSAWEEGERTGDVSKMAMAAQQLGGEYWYKYVKALPNPSAALLDRAAEQVGDPVKAAELGRPPA